MPSLDAAERLLGQMERGDAAPPNAHTLSMLMGAYGERRQLSRSKMMWGVLQASAPSPTIAPPRAARRSALATPPLTPRRSPRVAAQERGWADVVALNGWLQAAIRCGRLQLALQAFQEAKAADPPLRLDVVTFGTLIHGLEAQRAPPPSARSGSGRRCARSAWRRTTAWWRRSCARRRATSTCAPPSSSARTCSRPAGRRRASAATTRCRAAAAAPRRDPQGRSGKWAALGVGVGSLGCELGTLTDACAVPPLAETAAAARAAAAARRRRRRRIRSRRSSDAVGVGGDRRAEGDGTRDGSWRNPFDFD